MSLVLVPNPAFAGLTPKKLEAVCHDGTPFLTAQCSCGQQMHIHESQIANVGDQAVISRCHGCRGELEFPPGWFQDAFARLRREGWID